MAKKFIRKISTKIRYAGAAIIMAAGAMIAPGQGYIATAESCPELKIIFARGSGAERWTNDNYQEFSEQLVKKLAATTIKYEIEDLDYPAVGIGVKQFNVLLGAAISGGEAYEFGASVSTGVKKLKHEVNETCAATKFVLAGYSQGAMAVSKALPELNAEKIIYAATFGDPKIYLPEGKPPIPEACFGRNLSEYREYVPDCMAYKGLLGAYTPYQPDGYSGKLGTWCNKTDIFCSTYFDVSSHTAYVTDEIYKAASEKIFEKILAGLSPSKNQDVMILFHTNWKLEDRALLAEYGDAALKFGKDMLAAGARVSLYAVGAHNAGINNADALKICGFDECDAARLEEYFYKDMRTFNCYVDRETGEVINNIAREAQMASARENWREDAEKLIVVYTKYDYNRSAINTPGNRLPAGAVVVDGEVNPNTDLTMTTKKMPAAHASLSSAAAFANTPVDLPEIKITNMEENGEAVTINFENSGSRAIVVLNDAVLGITNENKITLTGLNRQMSNIVRLVAANDTRRGQGTEVVLDTINATNHADIGPADGTTSASLKAPNAGQR